MRLVDLPRWRWTPPRSRHAAVAAIFRDGPSGLELLLTRRARRHGDPWSGHISFPSGLAEPGETRAQTARREVAEEVGLDLDAPIGRGPILRALTHGGRRPLVVHPLVFTLTGDPALRCEPTEVADAFWVLWTRVVDPAARTTRPWKIGPLTLRLPGVPLPGESLPEESLPEESLPEESLPDPVLWGLTLRMIDDLDAMTR